MRSVPPFHSALLALAALALSSPARAAEAPAAIASDTVRVVVAHAVADSESIAGAAPRSTRRGLLRADRLQHATLSFALASGAGSAGVRRPAAFAITIALGTAKELRDRRHGGFDPVDLGADAIGAALGAWVAARR